MAGKGDTRRACSEHGNNNWDENVNWGTSEDIVKSLPRMYPHVAEFIIVTEVKLYTVQRKPMAKIREEIEQQLINRIVDGEFATASSNRSDDNDEFDSYIDLLDSVRRV